MTSKEAREKLFHHIDEYKVPGMLPTYLLMSITRMIIQVITLLI